VAGLYVGGWGWVGVVGLDRAGIGCDGLSRRGRRSMVVADLSALERGCRRFSGFTTSASPSRGQPWPTPCGCSHRVGWSCVVGAQPLGDCDGGEVGSGGCWVRRSIAAGAPLPQERGWCVVGFGGGSPLCPARVLGPIATVVGLDRAGVGCDGQSRRGRRSHRSRRPHRLLLWEPRLGAISTVVNRRGLLWRALSGRIGAATTG